MPRIQTGRHFATTKTLQYIAQYNIGTADDGWTAIHALGDVLAIFIATDWNNAGDASLLLFDITNRAVPGLMSNTTAIGTGGACSARIIGTNLYVGVSSYLAIYDISNLAVPSLSGSVNPADGAQGMAHTFSLSGSIYMAVEQAAVGEFVSVFDVTNPGAIALVGSSPATNAFQDYTCGYGTTFFVPNDVPDLMHVVDCSTPAAPAIASSIVLTDSGGISSASAATLFFQRGISGYIRAYDVSTIAAPAFGSEFKCDSLDANPFATGSFTDGTYLYSTNYGGRESITMKDITNLAAVSEVGNLTTQHSPSSSNPICAIGSYIYVITYDWVAGQNQLEVYQYA